MTIKLVNLKNCPKRIDNGVYIGRGSKWGNPFVIGKDGDRKTVVAKYRKALWCNKVLLKEVAELEGKTLLCFCAPDDCHGHVLIAAAKWLREEKLEREAEAIDDAVERQRDELNHCNEEDPRVRNDRLNAEADAATRQALALHDAVPS